MDFVYVDISKGEPTDIDDNNHYEQCSGCQCHTGSQVLRASSEEEHYEMR